MCIRDRIIHGDDNKLRNKKNPRQLKILHGAQSHSFKKATITAVQPPGRYGALELSGNSVKSFQEKPLGDNAWINGGFFVLDPSVIKLITNDQCMWEDKPLKFLASNGELNAYKHFGYWQPMDTLRDRKVLHDQWTNGKAPWKIWK